MPEFLRPDVYTTEVPGRPRVPSVSVSVAGFEGVAERGPVNEPILVGTFEDAQNRFGTYRSDSYLMHAVDLFFKNGGTRAYINRVVGSGSAAAELSMKDHGGGQTYGAVQSGSAEPYNLEPAQTLTVKVDGQGSAQVATFNATRATLTGTGGSGAALTAGAKTMQVKIDSGEWQTISFAGGETQAQVVDAINAQLLGGYAVINGTNVDLTSDTRGTSSHVYTQTVDPDITLKMGIPLSGDSGAGTGNVVNINAVTATEAALVITTALTTPPAAATVVGGKVVITTATAGSTGSVQVTGGTANTTFVFDTSIHAGTDFGLLNTLKVKMQDPGAFGNNLSAETGKVATVLTTALSNGDSNVFVSSVVGFEVGDVIYVDGGTQSVVAVIRDVDPSTSKLVTVGTVTLGAPIAIGSAVKSASQHRVSTTVKTALPAGNSNRIEVISTRNVKKGQLLSIFTTATVYEAIVDRIDGNYIYFTTSVSFPSGLAVGTFVVSQEFKLFVYEDGEGIDGSPFTYLSMMSVCVDYVETRLAGEGNESLLIELEDLVSATSTKWKLSPYPAGRQALTGGSDGATAGDSAFIGNAGAKTGLYAFDNIQDVNFMAIPGVIGTDAAVQAALVDYCDGRKLITAICDSRLTDDEAVEVRDYRLMVLNKDTSYGSLFAPWLKMADPLNDGQFVFVPPSGVVAGVRSNVASTQGVHIAPANIAVSGVVGLSVEFSDDDHDILNPIGVNLIRSYPGRGIRIMGARTLQTAEDGLHYINIRELFNYIKRSVKIGLFNFLYAPIDQSTWDAIASVLTTFFTGMWRSGMLVPSTNQSQAFFVKCDADNNPKSVQDAGRIEVEAGVNPPRPAEFIHFKVGLIMGQEVAVSGV